MSWQVLSGASAGPAPPRRQRRHCSGPKGGGPELRRRRPCRCSAPLRRPARFADDPVEVAPRLLEGAHTCMVS
eukprot:6731951-Pyramimonas_sp.AAC.1